MIVYINGPASGNGILNCFPNCKDDILLLDVARNNFPILCDNHIVQWELVKQGVGIGGVSRIIGDAEPRVCRVVPDMEPIIVPMWLVTHRELNKSKRVRTVFDFLAAELSQKP